MQSSAKERETPQEKSLQSRYENYDDELRDVSSRLARVLQKLIKKDAEISALKRRLGFEVEESSDDNASD